MGQGTARPCKVKGCGKPCFGDRCRSCVDADRHRHFQLGSPSGYAANRVEPTRGSWWAGNLPRAEFQRIANEDAPRMSRGICGNVRSEPVANWIY